MGDFVHLHLHTEYSLLDGATRIKEIPARAKAIGQDAVAITDHGVMYGAVEFYETLKAEGIKPIIGCEVYVAERSRLQKEGKVDQSGHHLILLCKNEVGYRNLSYMVSMSFIDGFYGKPRIDMDLIREHHEGLICLSGCIAGKIPNLILAGAMEEAEKYALEMKSLFGEDFYLEIQNHGIEDERKTLFGLLKLADKLGIEPVATNDAHYVAAEDADMQATLLCIQTNHTISEGRPFGFETDDFYMKSGSQMKSLFPSCPRAIENTVKIAEKCNFNFEFGNLHLPTFTPPHGLTHENMLREKAYAGLEERIDDGRIALGFYPKDKYIERMEYELSVILKMGFAAYYLIVADFVGFAKSRDIPVGPGRGSGAASLVAFCIGITDLDPLQYDLLFERFLNPERVSMPDFDIDFCYSRREEVIEYVKQKYGSDKVAQIVTFGTLAARAAVRDVGRALGMSYARVDSVAKLIPQMLNITIDDALNLKELRDLYENDEEIRKLIDISRKVEGMPRHASTHAAGVVITEKPTYEYVPLSYSGTGIVTQFDMNTDAHLGLVKFDFLGLRYLTVIHDAERMIRLKEPSFDLEKIPLDDSDVYRMLCEARSDGVFQLESGGMKQVIAKLRPTCIDDIIACIALFRPGPMDSIGKFIARKHGEEPIEYAIPDLAPILDPTYGCIVYQEQVMQIFRTLAGYSFAHADIVRRAMAKKKADAMEAERHSFLAGCAERGIDTKAAEKLFDEMADFANYAFNKSHAAAYGLTSYRTAYLKRKYPAEYYAALMTSVLGNAGKLREYISDAEKCGVKLLAPHINSSFAEFTVEGNDIRYSLLAIRNVGRPFAEAVGRERSKGSFRSFDDFVSRLRENDLNKRSCESLIKCGFFDGLGASRASLLQCYEAIIESEHDRNRNNISGQIDFFTEMTNISSSYSYPDIPEFELRDKLLLEKEASGLYFSGQLIDSYQNAIAAEHPDSILDIHEESENLEAPTKYADRSRVKVCGILTSKKTKVVKNGETMAFLTVEDRYSEIEVIVFARSYAKYASLLQEERAFCIEGTLSLEEGENAKIILSSVSMLSANNSPVSTENPSESEKKAARLFIRLDGISPERLRPLYRISSLNRGTTEVVLYDLKQKKYVACKDISIRADENVLARLGGIYGKDNVIFR